MLIFDEVNASTHPLSLLRGSLVISLFIGATEFALENQIGHRGKGKIMQIK